MSAKALRTQLLGAIAMVLVATLALGSSTFAWFAINSTVNATGMKVTTQVSDNLFISSAEHATTTKNADNTFGTTLVQTVNGLLEPTSTVDAETFFYSDVTNVKGDGSVKLDTWHYYGSVGRASHATLTTKNNFEVNYSADGAVGFVDYVYELKAVAGNTTDLRLTELKLSYADAIADVPNVSFRAAVFVMEITDSATTAAVNNQSKANKAEVPHDSVWLFNSSIKGASPAVVGVNFTPNKAVNSESTIGDVSYGTANDISVSTGTHYYKVLVRLWLEGEDTKCNNTTFAQLDDGKWQLDCKWQLGEGATTTVMDVVETTKTALGALNATVTTTNPVVINGENYYSVATVSSKTYYTKDTTLTTNSNIYTISEGFVTDVTYLVSFTITPAP